MMIAYMCGRDGSLLHGCCFKDCPEYWDLRILHGVSTGVVGASGESSDDLGKGIFCLLPPVLGML